MQWSGVLIALAVTACGDEIATGPFDGLPLDGLFTVGVSAPVHMGRDRTGVAHIYAQTIGDAAFVQGYVMAHDRLPQMDVLRRYGAGTLAELYGAVDPAVIDGDLEMRMHRMQPLAVDALDELRRSPLAADHEIADVLQRFADGVNRYTADLGDGLWTVDPSIAPGTWPPDGFDPSLFAPWAPTDSLVIVELHALSQSWSVPFELDATALYDGLRDAFDAAPASNPAAAARHGLSRDLWRLAPVGNTATLPLFPAATSSDSRPGGTGAPPAVQPQAEGPSRPRVPPELLASARRMFDASIRNGPLGRLGAHALLQPHATGNTWAVGPRIAGGSSVILGADLQQPLTDPSTFYPTHLIIAGGDGVEVNNIIGATLPGVPGAMVGANGNLAWAGIASGYDVNDIYLEDIAPCSGGGDCVAWTDPQGIARSVPITVFTEQIKIGAYGAITDTRLATYEVVPHHGPIIPAIDRATHELVPRAGNAALSVRYIGYQPAFDLRALYNLARASTVDAGVRAVADVTASAQSIMLIDRGGHIGWTATTQLPVRKPAAYGWDPTIHQDSLAPFFVLPGNGDGDWLGDPASPLSSPQLRSIDPPSGYLVAANADPVGATFDGSPLDSVVDGQPFYLGVRYAAGLRDQRIAALIHQLAAGDGRPELDAAGVQGDTRSNAGAVLAPAIVKALGRLDRQNLTPTDVNPYLDTLSPADTARLATARALLTAWTFATPAALDASDDDSAATAIFHAWMHYFIERALADELAVIGEDVWRLDDDRLIRIVAAMLTDPRSFATSPTTQQPVLCDDYNTSGPDDSCTKVVLQAMVDAMTHLASPDGFGTDDTRAWRWGQRHRLVIDGQGGAADMRWSRPGDSSSVRRSDPQWQDLDLSQLASSSALQFVAKARAGRPIAVQWAFPGGAIDDRRSPHDRDLLDGYLSGSLFNAAVSIDEIVAAGEARWVFR